MVTVAIIDDGIYNVAQNIHLDICYIYRRGRFVKTRPETESTYNHGTLCASIISSKCVSFISVKIIENGMPTNIQKLKKAISLSFSLKVNIIHLSLGSYKWWDGHILQKVIDSVTNQGKVFIVASADIHGRKTYPACFPGVIGVCHSDYLNPNQCVVASPNISGINVYLKAPDFIVNDLGIKISVPPTSSFAAALLTKKLALWLNNNGSNDLVDFYRTLDSSYAPNTSNFVAIGHGERMLLILYKNKKPKIIRRYLMFNPTKIHFYKCSNVTEGIIMGLTCISKNANIYILCQKGVNFHSDRSKNEQLQKLLMKCNIIMIADKEITDNIGGILSPSILNVWKSPAKLNIYNRLFTSKSNVSHQIKYCKHISYLMLYLLFHDDIMPLTDNPLYALYGFDYIEKNYQSIYSANCRNTAIVWIN